MQKNTWGIWAVIAGNILFGSTVYFVKVTLNAGMPYFGLIAWRIIIAAAVLSLLAFFGVFKVALKGKRICRLIPLGLILPSLNYIFEVMGIGMTSACESGTITALVPIVVLVVASLWLKEDHTRIQTVAVFVSVAGVIVTVIAGGVSASFSLPGYLLLFGAVCTLSAYNILVRKLSDEFTGIEITLVTNVVGAAFYIIFICGRSVLFTHDFGMILSLPFEQPIIMIGILYIAIGSSVIGYTLYNYGISAIGSTRSSACSGITSLTSIMCGILFLDESFSLLQVVGAVLIIGGAWAVNVFVPRSGLEMEQQVIDNNRIDDQLALERREG